MEASIKVHLDATQDNNSKTTEVDVKPSPSHPSNRQEKRMASYLQRKEIRRQVRKAYKDRRKLRRKLAKEMPSNKPYLTPQITSSTLSLSRKALQHVPPMSASSCTTKVVIDCAYDHFMSFKDLCKLANQVCGCYALNRRASSPVQLYITGLGSHQSVFNADPGHLSVPLTSSGVRLIDRLRIAGCEHWDINLCDDDYTKLFPAESIVYLCAESPFRLPDCFSDQTTPDDTTQFSTNDVYVIGGLVDHNHRIGHCYEQALARRHRTAHLPISELGMVLNGRQVLSTIQVFQALAPVLAGSMTWAASLNAAIPPRKTVHAAIAR